MCLVPQVGGDSSLCDFLGGLFGETHLPVESAEAMNLIYYVLYNIEYVQ